MNILYECVAGKAPVPFIGILFLALGIPLTIAYIAMTLEVGDFDKRDACIILILCLFVLLGAYALHDGRYKQVYATVNENASWKDINNDYTLLGQKGELYIFRVNDERAAENEH